MKKLKCVMLVDDDEITNKLNVYIMQKLDFIDEIIIALNGKVALEILEERSNSNLCSPELILLDINMPVMNGFEFLDAYDKRNIANKSSIIIMMLTTSINKKDIENADNKLITKFLNKPLSEAKIRELMDEYFGE